eukprot:scaffold30971_cov38-Prasinocladus_malaysianus.AAC.1
MQPAARQQKSKKTDSSWLPCKCAKRTSNRHRHPDAACLQATESRNIVGNVSDVTRKSQQLEQCTVALLPT